MICRWNYETSFFYRSCKSSNPFSCILKLFLFFGIDFYRSKKSESRKKGMWLVHKLVVSNWCIVLLIIASYFKYTLNHVENKDYSKLRFVRILEMTNSVAIFYVVHRSRRKVSLVVSRIVSLVESFHLRSSNFFSVMSVVAVAFSYVLICLCVLYPYNSERYRNIFDQFTFGALSSQSDQVVFYSTLVLICNNVVLIDVIPFCVVLFYGSLCKRLQDVLLVYAKNLEVLQASKKLFLYSDLEECFDRYNAILTVLHQFEDAMSFPILLATTRAVFGTLFGIVVMQRGCSMSYIPLSGLVLLFTFCFGSFLMVSCLALGVNECDKRAKRVHHELLKELLPGGISLKPDKKVSFLIMNSEPPFALTGWGFFHFTKGFLLGAVGCLFTYAFFIANL